MNDEIVSIPEGELFFSEGTQNDRTVYDEGRLTELAQSIASQGLQYPPIVRRVDGRYEVVAGHRRTLACRKLGWETIPVIIREMSDEQAEEIMLVENTGRVDLDPIDEANAYRRRMTRFGWSVEELAKKAGKTRSIIERRLDLLNLVPELQIMVRSGQLPVTMRPRQAKQHAELVAGLDDFRQRQAMRVLNEGGTILNLASFRALCTRLEVEQSQQAMFDLTELFRAQAVEERKPLHGKGADIAHLRNSAKLPKVPYGQDWTNGEVISSYIASLRAAGLDGEARAVEKLYRTMIRYNLAHLPRPGMENKWKVAAATVEFGADELG